MPWQDMVSKYLINHEKPLDLGVSWGTLCSDKPKQSRVISMIMNQLLPAMHGRVRPFLWAPTERCLRNGCAPEWGTPKSYGFLWFIIIFAIEIANCGIFLISRQISWVMIRDTCEHHLGTLSQKSEANICSADLQQDPILVYFAGSEPRICWKTPKLMVIHVSGMCSSWLYFSSSPEGLVWPRIFDKRPFLDGIPMIPHVWWLKSLFTAKRNLFDSWISIEQLTNHGFWDCSVVA